MLHRIGEYPISKIIAFTASADPAYLTAAREAGADGFWYVKPSVAKLSRILEGNPALRFTRGYDSREST